MMKLAEIQAACGVLCVDLAAVVDNYQTLARHVAPAQCGAVLKANGYGLGAEAIAPALYAANCRIFFVAQLSEGVALRKILSADAMVVLLNGVMPQAMPLCCAQQITPLLNSVDQVMAWLAAIFRQRGWAAPDYIISHLANADRPDHALNVYQHTLLQQAKEAFPTSRYSLANSCGMFLHPAWREDLCRPGVALFGVAQPWFSTPLKPAFTLTLSILRVQDVPVGTPIGYGSTVTTTRPLRIATVSAGYADGIPRNLRPPAGVCWRGVRLPVLGRVCMDSFMVDASAIMPTPGDVVEFIGVSQTLEEVAAACDTIPYEIMTRLGGRFRRIMQPAEA
ncbi:alanine racemase 3 [Salmonella enterica subsp. enterica serovar Enteritidis]|nr:alanine racemase 3 [Salmonella enterica subsp. enterica serovar Enteritidis]